MVNSSAASIKQTLHRRLKQETEENAASPQQSYSKTSKEGRQKDRRSLWVLFLILIVIIASAFQANTPNQNSPSGSLRSKTWDSLHRRAATTSTD